MSNYVTISCVSHNPPRFRSGVTDGEVIDAMMRHWRSRLDSVLPDEPDIVVLPEYCDLPTSPEWSGGQPMSPDALRDFLDHRGDTIRDFFAGIAAAHNTYIAYSTIYVEADGSLHNSIHILDRQGATSGIYHKVFLTHHEHDVLGISYGNEFPIFELDFGRVAPAICFDMQFEELRVARALQRPDLILFSSAYHGGLVQNAWAFQCRAYFAGSVSLPAPCTIISPVGELLGKSINYRDDVTRTVNLDAAVLARGPNVQKFSEIKRRYRSTVRLHNPGELGAVLLTSERKDMSVDDIIAEFGLERIDDFYDRVRKHRAHQLGGAE